MDLPFTMDETNKTYEDELEEMKLENANLKKAFEEMKAKIECPVCMEVPREGPIRQCPNGHLLCPTCVDKRERDKKTDCPSCRAPMGQIQSLLATSIIEDLDHECTHRGCAAMVHFKEYNSHLEKCLYRLGCCPNINCGEEIVFKDLEQHVRICPLGFDFQFDTDKQYQTFDVEKTDLNENVKWVTHWYDNAFLQTERSNGEYIFEVGMVADKEECSRYMAEILLFDKNDKIVVRSSYPVNPIETKNDKKAFHFSIKEELLSRIWENNHHTFQFKLDFNIIPAM